MKSGSLVAGMMFLLLSALPAAAQGKSIKGFATVSLDLFAGPATHFPAVAQVLSGTNVEILGCLNAFLWCEVIADDERGWIDGRFLSTVKDEQTVRVTDYGAQLGLPTLVFDQKLYWATHYADRPFFNEPRHWGTPFMR